MKLKNISSLNKALYTKLHFACSPFFKSYEGADIIIESQNNKKYRIKFFPFFTDGKFVSVYKDERKDRIKVNIIHNFSLGTTYSEGRVRFKAPDGDQMVTLTGLSVKRNLNMDFGEDRSNDVTDIIVYSRKVNRFLFADNKQNHAIVVDNGIEYTDGSLFYSDKMISDKLNEFLSAG